MSKVSQKVVVYLDMSSGNVKATDLAEFVASVPPFANVYLLANNKLEATWAAKTGEITVPETM